jgi:hypothetical protein
LHGYNSSIKWNFQRFFGAEFEHSGGLTGTEEAVIPNGPSVTAKRSLYTFAGGIQVKDNSPKTRLKPVGHVLFGAAADISKSKIELPTNTIKVVTSKTDFLMIFGGGLDVKINRRFSVRVFQFDHLKNRTVGPSFTGYIKYYRFGAGIVFH